VASETTKRSWLNESKRYLLPLTDAASDEFHTREIGSQKDDAATEEIGSTLRSMQHWISSNPCPDRSVRARLEAVAGRYGFLALVLETKHEARDKGELGALGDRLEATNITLRAVIADVEKGLEGEDTDDA
jgi:hypothetical protein